MVIVAKWLRRWIVAPISLVRFQSVTPINLGGVMPEVRIGRQIPTEFVTLPYYKTKGAEAIKLYNKTGRTAQEWQELLIYDILAQNEEKLWTHTKFGYSVPRRNGKNEVVAIRELWGLKNGEHIMHTAHRTSTTHAAWDRLLKLVTKAKLQIKSSYRAFGKEHIELENGGKIEFRTRTAKGGLGEGFDLLVIDEAQEYTDDQESALKYVVSDSNNPQTVYCGTPPTPVSSGTVFLKLRQNALGGKTVNTGWAEWSVDKKTDVRDKEAWYQTNPSLGTILTERKILDEVGNDDDDFNIQRLGLWLRYNQKSAISSNEWAELQVQAMPKLVGGLFLGVKYSKDGTNVAMSVASRTDDGRIFVECIDCRPTRAGNSWMIPFMMNPNVYDIVVDGANGQQLLEENMREMKLKAPLLPTVKEVIVANAAFEQGIFSKEICHAGQPSLAQTVSNSEKRAIGTNGGFGYKSLADNIEIALMDSTILAYWLCSETKIHEKQRISY